MTTQQISSVLGISQDTIRRWRKAGVIPAGVQVHEFAPIEWSDDDLQVIREFMRSTGRLQHDLDEVANLLRDINK